MSNLDRDTMESFGDEWTGHDQGRMMAAAGLVDITFPDRAPFCCAVGYQA